MNTFKKGYQLSSLTPKIVAILYRQLVFAIWLFCMLRSYLTFWVLKTAYEAKLCAAKVCLPQAQLASEAHQVSKRLVCLLLVSYKYGFDKVGMPFIWYLVVLSSTEQKDYSHIFYAIEKKRGKLSKNEG